MKPQMDIQGETSDKGTNPPSASTAFTRQYLAHVWYCTKCRDVSLGSTCLKCQTDAALTEGTIEQYKQVGQAVLNNQSEWREILETMIVE